MEAQLLAARGRGAGVRGRSVRGLVWRSNEVIYNDDFPARGKEPFVFDYSEEIDTP